MRLFRTLVLSIALLGAGAVYAQGDDHGIVEALITGTATPEQHKALADYYKAEAAQARSQAEMHRRMETRYGTTKYGAAQKPHCAKIASDLDDMAKQYDALAEAHGSAAK